MARLVLLVLALVPVGCHAPGIALDPFALGRQTRVPPPPTNAIGNASSTFYQAPPTLAPMNSGAANSARQEDYWQPPETATLAEASPRLPGSHRQNTPPPSETRLSENDRLSWRDPGNGQSEPRYPTVGTPRLLPPPDPVASVGRAPFDVGTIPQRVRVRGFSHASTQDVRIPAELIGQAPIEVRQAARWQPRHDEPRR